MWKHKTRLKQPCKTLKWGYDLLDKLYNCHLQTLHVYNRNRHRNYNSPKTTLTWLLIRKNHTILWKTAHTICQNYSLCLLVTNKYAWEIKRVTVQLPKLLLVWHHPRNKYSLRIAQTHSINHPLFMNNHITFHTSMSLWSNFGSIPHLKKPH